MANEKILVVDDEESIREAMDEFLKAEGYEVDLAENGSEALKRFEENQYDLIFMDISMPGINGIETLREMKKSKPKTKGVIITGLPDEEAFERAASIVDGTIEGFIAKPFKPHDIRQCLEKVFKGEKLPSFCLTPRQENVLIEIGKSGAEKASRSLASIINKEIKIHLQKVRSFSLKKLLQLEEKTETIILGSAMYLEGEIAGRMVVLLSWESGLNLIDLRTGVPMGTTKTFSTDGLNTVKSMVMVLSKSYLSTVSKSLNLSVASSFPTVFFDTEEAILGTVAKDFTDEYIFTIETEVTVADTEIKSRIMMLPDTDSLKLIFKNMKLFKPS